VNRHPSCTPEVRRRGHADEMPRLEPAIVHA
jgi:hypothetical protein